MDLGQLAVLDTSATVSRFGTFQLSVKPSVLVTCIAPPDKNDTHRGIKMSPYHHYHPYRFSAVAGALTQRVSQITTRPDAATAVGTEYAGIGDDELQARMHEYRRLIDTHARWVAEGRQIFDMASVMAPLAGAEDIRLSALPALRLPDVFYVHFGKDADIMLFGEDTYVDGAYFIHTEEKGEPGYRFTVVCGQAERDLGTATAGDLLKAQTRLASGFASAARPFRAGMDKLSGDPAVCEDDLVGQILDRLELSLAYVADPNAVPDLQKEVHVGRRIQAGPLH